MTGNGVFVVRARNLFDNFDSDLSRDREPTKLEMLDFFHRSLPTMHLNSQNYNQSQDAVECKFDYELLKFQFIFM